MGHANTGLLQPSANMDADHESQAKKQTASVAALAKELSETRTRPFQYPEEFQTKFRLVDVVPWANHIL
eukprot:9886171-Prorocentrum_lima.AAC.1